MPAFKHPWSIGRVVGKTVAAWRAENSLLQMYTQSRLQRELYFAGERPLRFVITTLALHLLVYLLAYIVSEGDMSATWPSWGAEEQLGYFGTLWAIQATLAALVYPIVIAFVTLFLQRRPRTEAVVNLYMIDSGALVAGLSSLTLLIAMAFQYLLIPLCGIESLPPWVVLDSVWFAANVVLTALFLYRTIEFLRPAKQLELVKRYIAAVALPRQVSASYMRDLFSRAQESGWIPSQLQPEEDFAAPTAFLGASGPRKALSEVHVFHSKPKVLSGIRTYPLSLAVRGWLKTATSEAPNRKIKSSVFDTPSLFLPFLPGQVQEGRVSVARIQAGPDLTRWQRALVRHSLVFTTFRHSHQGVSLAAILSELESDASQEAIAGNSGEFERTVRALIDIHKFLLGACLVKREPGNFPSWSLLPDSQGVFPLRLYETWTARYRALMQSAIDTISRDTRPLRRLCGLPLLLDGDELKSSPLVVRTDVLHLPPMLMHLLSLWWERQVGDRGASAEERSTPTFLQQPLRRTYGDVIKAFITGWEQARDNTVRWMDADNFSSEPILTLELPAKHISETSRMLVAAARRGDAEAAEWLADSLVKWSNLRLSALGLRLDNSFVYSTLDDTFAQWEVLSSANMGAGSGNAVFAKVTPRSIANAALLNYLIDVRLLTVEILLSMDDPKHPPALALSVASGILVGRQWHTGGKSEAAVQTAPQFVDALLRHYVGSQKGSSYPGRLDQFVEETLSTPRFDAIGSRSHFFTGVDDVASLITQQLVILGSLSQSTWHQSADSMSKFSAWASKDVTSYDIVERTLTKMIDSLVDPPSIELERLLAQWDAPLNIQARWTNARQGLERTLHSLRHQRTTALANAAIDTEQLTVINEAISSESFDKARSIFPMSKFRSITTSPHSLNDVVSVEQVAKYYLVGGSLGHPLSLHLPAFTENLSNAIDRRIMNDVTRRSWIKSTDISDQAQYWQAIKTNAAKIVAAGNNPLLIVPAFPVPDFISAWQFGGLPDDQMKPADLHVQSLDHTDPNYVTHLNDIPVFSGPLANNEAILIAQEAFDELVIRQYAPHRYSDVAPVPLAADPLLVSLLVTCSIEVRVKVTRATRFVLSESRHAGVV